MAQITVDFAQEKGVIKAMHSVNNGPSAGRGIGNFETYTASGYPMARTHDAAFSAAYGGSHTVDIIAIFPDFDADENDPASYDFVLTDEYMEHILASGTKVFYRLGNKIEHEIKRYGAIPPKDFAKWARICEHIIRHMNEGWADGHNYGIEYWEIWNEPDLHPQCWDGTNEAFYELYDIASRHLKKCFPNLKIGGPAVTGVGNKGFCEGFFSYITRDPANPAPMDFFSFHCYAHDPSRYSASANTAREMCDRYGYKDAELILNEWNYVSAWTPKDKILYSYMANRSLKGASFVAASVISAQNSPMTHFMYYDARPSTPWNGLYDLISKEPTKTYWSLYAWNELYKLGTAVETVSDTPDLYAVAAKSADGKEAAIFATFFQDKESIDGENTGVDPFSLRIDWSGFGGETTAEYVILDSKNDYAPVSAETFFGDKAAHILTAGLYTTVMVRLKKA